MFRAVTWNVNSIRSRLDRVLAFLEREKPDALCLQELKCEPDKFPLEAIREAGYFAAVHGQKTYNGVAVLTKEEPQNIVQGFQNGGDDSQARFVGATVGGVRIYSAYIPNGSAPGNEKFAYKMDWMKRLRGFLDKNNSAEEKLLLLGDFNVAPEDQDCHDPKAWKGRRER